MTSDTARSDPHRFIESMSKRLLLILATLALPGCRETARDRAGTASGYVAATDSGPARPGPAGTNTGVEFEAPRLIPGVRAQLELLASRPTDEANRTAHKNLISDLIQSMTADLSRVGLADSGAYKALADSVLRTIGGGTGPARGPETSELRPHIARVQRLIGIYEAWMRQAQARADSR